MKRTEFGQRALEARERKKLTQDDVCRALDMRQSTLQYAESRARGSAKTAELAELYGVSARWLSTGLGDMDDSSGEPPPQIGGSSFGGIPPGAAARFQSDPPTISWAELGTFMHTTHRAATAQPPGAAMQHSPRWMTVESDEMSPEIRVGDEIKLDPAAAWTPGSVIVCADSAGIWHLRRVQDVGAGEWLAIAANGAAYAPLRSTSITGLCRVVAVRSSRDI